MELSELKKKSISLPKLLLLASPVHLTSFLLSYHQTREAFFLLWIIISIYLLSPVFFPKKCLPLFYLTILTIKYQERIFPKKLTDFQYRINGYNPEKPDEDYMVKFQRKQFILMFILWCNITLGYILYFFYITGR